MKFSCIIPTYNCGKYIEKMVEQLMSCISDTLEVIVVDDGSTDNTRELLSKYSYENFKYMYFENSGVSVARNKGIKAATGDYLFFFDADDEVNINDLNKVIDLISCDSNRSDIYMTGYQIIRENERKKISVPYSVGHYEKDTLDVLKRRLIDVKIAKYYKSEYMGGKVYQYFVRKNIYERGLKFQKDIHFAEDLCYCMQLFYLANDITFLDLYPYKYNIINGSASHRYRQNLWDEWIVVYLFVRKYIQDEEALNRLVYWAGKNSIRHYAKFETYKNRKLAIEKILNNDLFQKAKQSIGYNDWTTNEKIENYLMDNKRYRLLYSFEKMIIALKK